jgi:glutamyl-tRNA reductase
LIVNRSAGRATGLAKQYGGEAFGWDRLNQALFQADIVISSTGAPHAILRRGPVASVMEMRRNRPLFVIDIAVPRDVEPEVDEISNLFLYDIDDLQQVLEANLQQRAREVPRVRAIVREEADEFVAWLRARDVVPTVVDLRRHIDAIREAELAWAVNKLGHLSDQEMAVVMAFSRRFANKILHQPTVRLKQHANGREAYRYTETLRDLFGLEDEEGKNAHG